LPEWVTTVVVSGLVCLYYAVDVIAVAFYDPSAGLTTFVPSEIASVFTLLPAAFAVIIYWGSTDFIEWGETVATNVANLANRVGPPWVLFSLVAVVTAGFMFDVGRRLSLVALAPSLVTGGVLLLVMALLLRVAKVDGASPAQVPTAALIAGAIFLFVFVQGAQYVTNIATHVIPLPPERINPFYTVVSVSTALVLLIASLVIIVRGRANGRQTLSTSGAFLGMIAILVVGLSTPQLANVFHLPVIVETQPNIADFKLFAGGATLLGIAWLILRRQVTARFAALITAGFALVVGLQVIGWYFQVFLPSLHQRIGLSAILAAIAFVGAILWDLLMSGDSTTNHDSPTFPRAARLLLYLAYALFASSAFLYATSQTLVSTGAIVSLPSDGAVLEVIGAEGLGLPLLAYTFTQRLGRWRAVRGTAG
jgi:hypothetical protein